MSVPGSVIYIYIFSGFSKLYPCDDVLHVGLHNMSPETAVSFSYTRIIVRSFISLVRTGLDCVGLFFWLGRHFEKMRGGGQKGKDVEALEQLICYIFFHDGSCFTSLKRMYFFISRIYRNYLWSAKIYGNPRYVGLLSHLVSYIGAVRTLNYIKKSWVSLSLPSPYVCHSISPLMYALLW